MMLDSTLVSNIMKVWKFDNFYEKSIPTEDLVKMVEFVFKNSYFEFNSNVKHQISRTAVGTK